MAEQRMPGSADRRELKRFARAGRRLVGRGRRDGAAAQAQSGAPGLHPRPAVRPSRSRPEGARLPCRAQRARCRLRRRAAVRAARAAGRGGHRHRPGAGQSRGRARSRAGRRARAVVPRDRGGAAGGGRCELRSGLRHGGGRARRRRAKLPFGLRHAGAAGRCFGPGDAQSHAQIIRPRHRRGRIHPRLAAARHAPVAALPAALGGREAAARQPASGSLI